MTSERSARGSAAQRRGRKAETLAQALLRLKGYRILARNMRPPRGSGAGEVDLIVRRGDVVAFVEIKARAATSTALESVSPAQQARLHQAAAWYLGQHPELASLDVRFDVVTVVRGSLPRHLADAWRPDA